MTDNFSDFSELYAVLFNVAEIVSKNWLWPKNKPVIIPNNPTIKQAHITSANGKFSYTAIIVKQFGMTSLQLLFRRRKKILVIGSPPYFQLPLNKKELFLLTNKIAAAILTGTIEYEP